MRVANVTPANKAPAWLALGACMLIPGISNGVFIVCYSLWVLPWTRDFHVSRGVVMAGFVLGNLVMGLSSPWVGRALERVPVRLSTAVGGVALAGGFLLTAGAHSIWQVIVLYSSLMALGAALTGVLVGQSVAVGIVPHKAGTVGGAVMLSLSAGGILVPIVLASSLAALGWRFALLVAAVIVLLTIVPAGWFALQGYGGRVPAPGVATDADLGSTRIPTLELLQRAGFWVPFLAGTSVMFIVGSVLTNTVSIAADSGIAAGVGGYLVPAMSAGGALGSISVGWLADRVDYRILFAAIAAAVTIALLLLMGHAALLPMAVAFGVVGFAGGGVFPLLGVIIVRGFGARAFARVLGALMPAIVIVNAFGPFITAWLRDLTGSYWIALEACAVLMVASGVMVVILRIAPGHSAPLAQSPPTQ